MHKKTSRESTALIPMLKQGVFTRGIINISLPSFKLDVPYNIHDPANSITNKEYWDRFFVVYDLYIARKKKGYINYIRRLQSGR